MLSLFEALLVSFSLVEEEDEMEGSTISNDAEGNWRHGWARRVIISGLGEPSLRGVVAVRTIIDNK